MKVQLIVNYYKKRKKKKKSSPYLEFFATISSVYLFVIYGWSRWNYLLDVPDREWEWNKGLHSPITALAITLNCCNNNSIL